MAALINRVTIVRPEGVEIVFKKKKKKNKVSSWLRPLERTMRDQLKANQVFNCEVLRRQKRSNRKQRNGWLRELGVNAMEANRKAMKQFE